MSREIKFRAWDKEQQWMVNDIQNAYDGMWSHSNSDEINGFYKHVSTMGSFTDNEGFAVMQYTGKRDNNDQEVYLNDIVEDEYGYRYEVVFKGDCLRCDGIRKGGYRPKNRWFSNDLEIVGNRYENPELLEEEPND